MNADINDYPNFLRNAVSKFQKGLNVLLVEDDRMNAALLHFFLERLECNIFIARDGDEAIQLYKTKDDFDLILMDVKMPLLDGIDATLIIRKIENDTHRKKIPIIGLTAAVENTLIKRASKAGMNRCLTKPIDMEELINTMEQVIH